MLGIEATGQHDEELAAEAWFVLDAEPEDPFLADAAALWRAHPRPPRRRLGRMALFSPHPSLN